MNFKNNFFKLIVERWRKGAEREQKQETLIYCLTYLCIHWLLLVCALTMSQTCNPGILGQHSKQLNNPATPSQELWTTGVNVLTEHRGMRFRSERPAESIDSAWAQKLDLVIRS